MDNSILTNLVRYGKDYMDQVGPAWSQDNADFEAAKPTLGDRVIRTVNPMTGFGSALGAMHDAGSAGLPARDTLLAAMQAWPVFGSMIVRAGSSAIGASKAVPAVLANDYLKTLAGFMASTATSVAADEVQAADAPKRPNTPNIK